MSLITKDKRNWASTKINWPNPYNLTEKDQKGMLEKVPIEIITLILKEIELQKGINFKLKNLQINGIGGSFAWNETKDGSIFWNRMCNGNFNVFYDVYTPEKLRQRLEE